MKYQCVAQYQLREWRRNEMKEEEEEKLNEES
jgi:hypothetical protein